MLSQKLNFVIILPSVNTKTNLKHNSYNLIFYAQEDMFLSLYPLQKASKIFKRINAFSPYNHKNPTLAPKPLTRMP